MVCAMRVRLDGERGLMDAYLRGDRDVIASVAATKREWLSLMGGSKSLWWVPGLMFGADAIPQGDSDDEGW